MWWMERLERAAQRENEKMDGKAIRNPTWFFLFGFAMLFAGILGFVWGSFILVDAMPFEIAVIIFIAPTFLAGVPVLWVCLSKRILVKDDCLIYRNNLRKIYTILYQDIQSYEVGTAKQLDLKQNADQRAEGLYATRITLFVEGDRYRYPNGKKYEFVGLVGLWQLDSALKQAQNHKLVGEKRGMQYEKVLHYQRLVE